MKRKLLLSAFAVLISLSILAQNQITDTTATVVGYWKKGDHIRLLSTTKKERSTNGKVTGGTVSTSTIEVLILDATANSYTINWKCSDVKVTGDDQNPAIQKFSKLNEGLVTQFKTDETGSFTELLNWKEIQGFVYKRIDELSKGTVLEGEKELIKKVKQLYSTKESIEQVLIKEVQIYHSIYGGEYKLHEKITAATAVNNFLGGEPFPANISIEMTELKPKEKLCTIRFDQSLDKEKTTKVINNWLNSLGRKPTAPKNIPVISINDESLFEVDLRSSWLLKARYKRVATMDDTRNTEVVELIKL